MHFQVSTAQRQSAEALIELLEREFNALEDDGKKVFVVLLMRNMWHSLDAVRKELAEGG